MTVDPRAALDRFVAALEAHYTAIVNRRDDEDPAVDDAYYVLADAFEVYDEALGTVHSEATPFYLGDEDDDEDDEDDDDEGDDEEGDDDADDDGPVSGRIVTKLGDDEYEIEPHRPSR
ncbi:primosomal protein [Sanguibacter suaedae]|uniref:primosomal protein n=1 Tax=Sanguibacter suaedae TaxID=2795737 RepID=UPI001E508178|nr:primosomal protein [Sanguibacter suaedae]